MASLFESLTQNTIALNCSADSWEEAIEQVGNLMVKAGIVEQAYIAAMVAAVAEIGPYIVIAPGIAMPHARPEDGVIKEGFCLITLQNPVDFGNKDNDPVDILIGFAAVDKDSHISALREIATHFSNTAFVDTIRKSGSVKALLHYFEDERTEI